LGKGGRGSEIEECCGLNCSPLRKSDIAERMRKAQSNDVKPLFAYTWRLENGFDILAAFGICVHFGERKYPSWSQ
jgi:hypothetical protein